MASNRVYASYQEIIDLHTEENKVGVIGFHTPVGDTPYQMFRGLFEQFKKYKYKGCSISLVPAARLPADISQVSYGAGEAPIDPRDILNPIMFHGCHGEDLGNVLNRLYAIGSNALTAGGSLSYGSKFADGAFTFEEFNGSDDMQSCLEALYYKALVDNTWKKAHPQKGFRKSGLRPLVYSMATTHQLGAAEYGNLSPARAPSVFGGNYRTNDPRIKSMGEPMPMESAGENTISIGNFDVMAGLTYLTPHLTGLGYLDTKTVLDAAHMKTYLYANGLEDAYEDSVGSHENWTQLPLVYMGVCLLPPAYKAEQYFRLVINHRFVFKDFRGISMANTPFSAPSVFDFNGGNLRKLPNVNPTLQMYAYDDGHLYEGDPGVDLYHYMNFLTPNEDVVVFSSSVLAGASNTDYGFYAIDENGLLNAYLYHISTSSAYTGWWYWTPTDAYPTRFTKIGGSTTSNWSSDDLGMIFGGELDAWEDVAAFIEKFNMDPSAFNVQFLEGDPNQYLPDRSVAIPEIPEERSMEVDEDGTDK